MKKKTLDQIVYDLVVKKIEKGQLNEKEHVTEQVIADELQISRTPVRKAFSHLVEDNYLEDIKNVGVRVKKKKVDVQSFQERIDFIEHLINYYLFNLEKRDVVFNVSGLRETLEELEDLKLQNDDTFEKEQITYWKELMKYNNNHYAKQNILKALKEILFEEGQVWRILKESRLIIFDHFTQLIKLLDEGNYQLSRRELRILFNQLKLNMIEINQIYNE